MLQIRSVVAAARLYRGFFGRTVLYTTVSELPRHFTTVFTVDSAFLMRILRARQYVERFSVILRVWVAVPGTYISGAVDAEVRRLAGRQLLVIDRLLIGST